MLRADALARLTGLAPTYQMVPRKQHSLGLPVAEPIEVKRRLAAIFAADVEGYSRLMGADEVATLDALSARREILDGLIATHGGRILPSTSLNGTCAARTAHRCGAMRSRGATWSLCDSGRFRRATQRPHGGWEGAHRTLSLSAWDPNAKSSRVSNCRLIGAKDARCYLSTLHNCLLSNCLR